MSFKNTSSTVTTKLTFPCTECNFEAQSARQLSRHKAVTHTQNALKCVLCPFVTAYQTNLLRHRKDVHGICGSKGNKSCKFCGFVSEDNDTLIHHQIEFHQDILKSARVKFAKELVSAGGDESIADFSTNFETSVGDDYFNQKKSFSLKQLDKKTKPKKSTKQPQPPQQLQLQPEVVIESESNNAESNEFDDFWKAGFMEQSFADQPLYYHQTPVPVPVDVQTESVNASSRSSTPKSQSSHNNNHKDLPATRIRRQYNCNDCGFRTVNPREFLYHRRDRHGYKIKIVECPYCVYACQYVQKLQRHLLLVHKLSTVMSASGESGGGNSTAENKKKKSTFQFNGNSILDNQDNDKSIDANDDNNSLTYCDYEPVNHFEMNLNEDGDQETNDKADDDDKTGQINLECFLCKVKFADPIAAQKHFLKIHRFTDSKGFAKNDSSLMQMSSNQKKVFDGQKSVHTCNYCGYKTRWLSELERHLRVHSKEKPFKCMYCDFQSKWKGDLNRHIQRYHEQADLESETNGNEMSPSTSNRQDEEVYNEMPDTVDDYPSSYECLMEVDDGEFNVPNTAPVANSGENSEAEPEDAGIQSSSGNVAKMYKCTYCDFMCSTASRFHVHYVQHLNTKPFQCSICGHRSNWEWDVTKHIKMKAQRDPNHEKARPVLIHDSGKRDYSKYNKFVVWVGQAEAEMANSDSNKIDFRAKRFKTDVDEPEQSCEPFPMDSILTPEVCFEVDEEANESSLIERNTYHNLFESKPMTNCGVLKSVIVFRHRNSRNQPVYCSQCNFKHQFARVMVAHMSNHYPKKPYTCKYCDFDSNWREVIVTHYESDHTNANTSDFDMHFRCAIDENGVCRILTPEELAQIEADSEVPDYPATTVETNSSLTKPNIYEEKAVIRCEHCPFLTTNLKKMTIHCRFHNPSKGSLKCKFCPYYVNNKDKLIRHQKLHQKIDQPFASDHNDYSQSFQPVSCSLCSFQSTNLQELSEHMKIHDGPSNEYNEDHLYQENLLEPEMSITNEDGVEDSPNGSYSNEYADNSVSLIDVNNMKNGNAKKFSYVCNDCPAAFKSPGDFKIHTDFHSSNYQHACPYCTYKARNKPQLCKHLYVHTAQYIAKRANSYPDGTKHLIGNQDSHCSGQATLVCPKKKPNSVVKAKQLKPARKHRTKIEFPMKPVKVKLNSGENGKQKIVFNNTDLMASQEFLETKEYLQRINSGIKNRCMYRCSKCPAVFTKVNTLIYHMTLHEQNSQFTCDSCSYSTVTEDNLSIHSLLHNLTESQSALGYNFNYNCHRCPAGFSKRSRLEKHLSLHGAKFNWKCDKCDYSVRYAATLVKHRALHLINPDFQAISGPSGGGGGGFDGQREAESCFQNGIPSISIDPQSDLKLKLNLIKTHDDDDDELEEEELQIDFSATVANDEENSQDENVENDESNDELSQVMLDDENGVALNQELIVESH